ncbi:MAG: ABC transporter permease [Erysipelotrichaceae bacterium]|nr:ABC transporter permease [Erysipelotrichaceae bacterium]
MNNILGTFLSASFIFVVIRVGVPLVYASMSAYVADLAGIPNIAVEGLMIMGALFGVYFSALFSNAYLGLLGAIVIGVLLSLIMAFFTMKMKTNPIMIGIALNLFAADFSIWLLMVWTGSKGTTGSLPSKVLPTINIPFIKDIPILGTIISGHYFLTYVCLVLVILIYILIYKTPFGLRMKACGLDEETALSVGIKVDKVRLIAIVISGILATLGGAYLSMGYLSIFSNNMTASRGWMGIAASSVGQGNMIIVLLTTGLFAISQGVVNELILTNLPAELINTIPYIVVTVGLIALSIKEYRKTKK